MLTGGLNYKRGLPVSALRPQEPMLLFVRKSQPKSTPGARPAAVENDFPMPRLKFQPSPRNKKLTSAGRSAPLVWLNSGLSAQKGFLMLEKFWRVSGSGCWRCWSLLNRMTSSLTRVRIWFRFVSWLEGEMLSQFTVQTSSHQAVRKCDKYAQAVERVVQ